MDLKKAFLERRVRSAVKDGDGRRLLDLLVSERATVGRMLHDFGADAGPVLADAVRVAKADDELRAAIGWAGSSGDPCALDEVRRILREGPSAARSEALSALLVHGTPDDQMTIAGLVSDPDERLRDDVYETLTQFERIGGADSLSAPVAAAIASECARRTETESDGGQETTGSVNAASAARMLVSVCDAVDATYSEPIPPDADALRASLREDIARVGQAAYEQGGEGLMREIAAIVASTSTHGSYLSREWSGIGSWMG